MSAREPAIPGAASQDRELLAYLLQKQEVDVSSATRIGRQPKRTDLPLSFAQQRLWFLDRLVPENAFYNLPRALHLKGPLDHRALQKSLDAIVARHETLRTTFRVQGDGAVQVIDSPRPVEIIETDLRATPASDRDNEVRCRAVDATQIPFDLSKGPLLRVHLFRLEEQEHVLLLVVHHIVSDGWSIAVLDREMSALYQAFRDDKPSPLSPLPIQYADYAVWQRQWLSGAMLADQLQYWTNRLDGLVPLQLPTDRVRPAKRSYRGGEEMVMFPAPLADALKALGRSEAATLFMTCLAAFNVLLARYTGQSDVTVGSPIANRTRQETEGLIGFLVNMLVIRTDVSGRTTFRQLLKAVRKTTVEAYDHQDVPFEKLVEHLAPERDLSSSPLFQVCFALYNAPRPPRRMADLAVHPFAFEVPTSRFDLETYLWEDPDGLVMKVTYDSDLFERQTIRRFMGHYQKLLEAIVVDMDQPIDDLRMLTDQERHQTLIAWNDTKRDYPKDRAVHRLFEQQVDRCPDAVAVDSDQGQLTYQQLNARANQLANHLHSRGVQPNDLVAILLDRSPEMVVAVLGVLKAGGGYVPLDPEQPVSRLAFMLDDAQPRMVLTQQSLMQRLPDGNATTICLDTDWTKIEQAGADNPTVDVDPQQAAYLMYTSGSTGQPKGVWVPQRAILRLILGVDYVRLGPEETLLQMAPVSFDASTFEIWGALLHGGTCVLYPDRVPSSVRLGEVIKQHGVTTLWLTASLFNLVIDEAPEVLGGVHQLLIGGEALSVPHVRRALELLPTTRVINGYGPTEGTTFSCCYGIPRDLGDRGTSVPIGRPIANTRVYVLDRCMQPVPVGVSGELYIGGDGLAVGYWNRPGLTAEKFVSDPFGEDPGSRLYRTGDLVRYRPDGAIEFLGRVDDQVKIRGFRIEPGEIESVLLRHPAVGKAVVLVYEDELGQRRLVGYVVGSNGQTPSVVELRGYLKLKLPDYMVPSTFVFLADLPLTPNGKVDRQSLPAPEGQQQLEQVYVAPSTETEQRIAAIWRDLLRVDRIGVHDNFFDLGGHSLMATRVTSRLCQTFDMALSPSSVFDYPTVAALAERIDAARLSVHAGSASDGQDREVGEL